MTKSLTRAGLLLAILCLFFSNSYSQCACSVLSPNTFVAYTFCVLKGNSTIISVSRPLGDSTLWYKVTGTDTSKIGSGTRMTITPDSTRRYLSRNVLTCYCPGGVQSTVYSPYIGVTLTLDTNSLYVGSTLLLVNNDPVLCNGTSSDVTIYLVNRQTSTVRLSTDNPNVTLGTSSWAGYTLPYKAQLTNATTTPQVVNLTYLPVVGSCGATPQVAQVTVLPSPPASNSKCYAPLPPAEYGGVPSLKPYKGARLELWAAKPSIAVDGREWYRVVGSDTTYLGAGDTLSATADTSAKYIARNKNYCTCGDSTKSVFYSTFALMANVATVDTGTKPTYSVEYSPTICSGTPTKIYLRTNNTVPVFSYLRDDTANVGGSVSGTLIFGNPPSAGPLGVTFTNRTSSPQKVRLLLRMYRNVSALESDQKVLYVTVLPDTPSTGDHCSVPPSPRPWPVATGDVNTYAKGAQIQLFSDSTVSTQYVDWYRITGSDTVFAGSGPVLPVTVDSAAKYIMRNRNYCSCNGESYYSSYALAANYSVSSTNVSQITVLNYMPTVLSGTTIDLVVKSDTFVDVGLQIWRDNAYVTGGVGASYSTTVAYASAYGFVLTNTTNVPQRVKYLIKAALGGVLCDAKWGYVTVLPSSVTALPGNHCSTPDRPSIINAVPVTAQYTKGSKFYLDLGGGTAKGNGSLSVNVYNPDRLDWYRSIGAGDTTYVGSTTPVSTTVDTTFRAYVTATNYCYWPDSSLHIYRSAIRQVAEITMVDTPANAFSHTNSKPVVCSGTATSILLSNVGYTQSIKWYRSNTSLVTGTDLGNQSGTALTISSTLTNTTNVPQKVYFVSFPLSNRITTAFSSQMLDSVILQPSCAGMTTAIRSLKDSICAGDTATLSADTIPGGSCRYAWSSGDTTKIIRPTVGGTYTVTVTNACGCSASTSRNIFINFLNPPSVIPWQSYCGDDMHIFSLGNVYAGTGGDEIEWCRSKFFDSTSNISSSPAILMDTVELYSTDTLWIRSRNSLSGCRSRDTIAIFANYPRPFPPKALNAIQSNVSDTPMAFLFTGITPGNFGNRLEWSFDSTFTTSFHADTAVDLSIIDSPAHIAAIWIRSVDTITGCRSSVSLLIAMLNRPLKDSIPPTYAFLAVCAGSAMNVPVPASRLGSRYYMRIDSIVVDSLIGTGDTINLSTGIVDSLTCFNIISKDTLSNVSDIVDSAFYVEALTLAKPYFVNDDTLIDYADTTVHCYTVIAAGAVNVIYTIDSGGGAEIDSLSGCVRNVTSGFTVRAHAYGVNKCGKEEAWLHVEVTDIGLPILPDIEDQIFDDSQYFSERTAVFTIDSVKAGVNADQIEWSTYADFRSSQILQDLASISITIKVPGDTVVYVRSRQSKSGKTSNSVAKSLKKTSALQLNAGLLDKSYWTYDLSNNLTDEFEYADVKDLVFPTVGTRKWWLNLCWGGGANECDPGDCNNHYPSKTTYQIYNTGNYNGQGIEGSGNEVFFKSQHPNNTPLYYAILRTSILSSALSVSQCPGYNPPSYYFAKTGFLASDHKISTRSPFLLECRVKRPSESVFMDTTLGPNNDIHSAAWMPGSATQFTPFSFSDDNRPYQTHLAGFGVAHPGYNSGCDIFVNNRGACDYTNDWFTYSMVYTSAPGNQLKFFINGKEMWSRDEVDINRFSDADFRLIFQNDLYSYHGGWLKADYLIDYVRLYKPNPINNPQGQFCLQNLQNGSAQTIENPKGQQNNLLSTTLPTSYYPQHILGGIRSGISTMLIYKESHGIPILARNSGSTFWSKSIIDLVGSFRILGITFHRRVFDVKDFVIPYSNGLFFFQTNHNELAYAVPYGINWLEHKAMNGKSLITDCAGYIAPQPNGVLFYKDLRGNICYWDWSRSYKLGNTAVAAGAIVSSKCGCMEFYRDVAHNLRQMYWWNGWQDLGVVVAGNVSDEIVIDDVNSRVYFIGLDHAIYYYSFDYASKNTSPHALVKLGQNATESRNQGPYPSLCQKYNALASLALGSDAKGNSYVYYKSTEGYLCYYFSDNEHFPASVVQRSFLQDMTNWNRSITEYPILGPVSILQLPNAADKLLYVGPLGLIFNPKWVNADLNTRPACSSTYLQYKRGVVKDSASIDLDNGSIMVNAYPNPSEDIFYIDVEGLNIDSKIELDVFTLDGVSVHQDSGELSDGSGHFSFIWNAKNVSAGVYFYTVLTTGGKRYSGKIIKI